jgi:hypothetical protein
LGAPRSEHVSGLARCGRGRFRGRIVLMNRSRTARVDRPAVAIDGKAKLDLGNGDPAWITPDMARNLAMHLLIEADRAEGERPRDVYRITPFTIG